MNWPILHEKLHENDKQNKIPRSSDKVWYFAYGSNMSSETFQSHRGIVPLQAIPVRIPGWTLTFDIYGIPYQEPSFSSISRIEQVSGAREQWAWATPSLPVVHGTAYLVSCEDYVSIIGSEGGGSAYEEVELLAERVPGVRGIDTVDGGNMTMHVMTLTRAYGPTIPRLPSKRYKDILAQGAMEAGLPAPYQSFVTELPCYEAPKSSMRLLGAYLFLAVWVPVMGIAQRLTRATVNMDGRGNCPAWVQQIVRLILLIMWFHHDFIHSKIWGRGDGLDQSSQLDVMEKGGAIRI
ncbi:hypothetical protein GQ44DRAFT_831630 [Phaeosphaeriaceae sp. PMI808]|nr:hypothetical protein GQ44DRAFT_831630 [Phaeosphaeriaceae sp. PMI808]